MKVLLYGGTFDPPHNGHLNNLRAAADRVRPDKVVVMPAGLSPFKQKTSAPGALRLEMCSCFHALEEDADTIPQLEVSGWEIEQVNYQCPACKAEDRFGIKGAAVPPSLLPHSVATPTLAASILCQKYVLAVPFYRQESAWAKLGFPLSRTNMANIAIALSRYYFLPLIGHMKKELLAAAVLHADETTVQVHRESPERSKRKKQQSYMWLYATSPLDPGSPDIRIFEYQPGRSGENAVRFLEGFQGMERLLQILPRP